MKDYHITQNMTVLEVIDRYRNTESFLKKTMKKPGFVFVANLFLKF